MELAEVRVERRVASVIPGNFMDSGVFTVLEWDGLG